MNWEMMLLMAAILAGTSLVAAACVWLMERFDVHPIWIIGGLFGAAILAVGVLTA